MQIKNVRFIIAAITTISAYAVYVSRVNLSLTIIAMVDEDYLNSTTSSRAQLAHANETNAGDVNLRHRRQIGAEESHLVAPMLVIEGPPPVMPPLNSSNSTQFVGGQNDNETLHRVPLSTIFPASKNSIKTPLISQMKFKWDTVEQGHILGAFFYGYILFQVPGARIAEKVGAKWIILAAVAGSSLVSLLFPLSTQLNSIQLLMALRFVMGLCQSAFFPAAYVLFCRWLPESERSLLLPIMFIGSNMGSISTYTMSSHLISSSYGWPSVFYLSGLVCALVSACLLIFVSNNPSDNWLITDSERDFIRTQIEADNRRQPTKLIETSEVHPLHEQFGSQQNGSAVGSSKLAESRRSSGGSELELGHESAGKLSWRRLVTSVPVWTLILSMYGNEWSTVVLCYELPTYLNSALSFPIGQNGVINSFFQLSFTLASPVMSSMGAYMLNRHVLNMQKIHVRRLFQSLATFGQMACFIAVPICGANRGLIIMFMFSATVFKACANAGDIMVSGDLSPEFAGTIFAAANSIGNTAGFFVPSLFGFLVTNPYDRDQWTPFWFTTAAIMGTSGLIFLVFGETNRQDFCSEKNEKTSKVAALG